MSKFYLLIISIALLIACEKIYKYENPNFHTGEEEKPTNFELDIVESKSFKLGKYATPFIRSVDTYSNNNTTYYSFFNSFDQSIYVYNYENETLLKKISLENQITKKYTSVTGYLIKNIDELIIYDFKDKTFIEVNGNGQPKAYYNLPEKLSKNVKYPPSPRGWTSMPIIHRGDQLIAGGFKTGEVIDETKKNRPTTIIFNYKEDSLRFGGYYPEVYRKGNWGGAFYRRTYYTYNRIEDLFVYSFPAEHYVYATHHSGEDTLKSYYAGSKDIPSISSLDYTKGVHFPKKLRRQHFASNYSYGEIIFDPYRNRYYRFAEKKKKNYEEDLYKQKILIGLNANFEKIFEFDLSNYFHEKIYPYGVFVTKHGLNLQLLDSNEDHINIQVVKFNQK